VTTVSLNVESGTALLLADAEIEASFTGTFTAQQGFVIASGSFMAEIADVP